VDEFTTQQQQKNCHRTNSTFGFARHKSQPFAKPKELFFADALIEITKFEN